MTTFSNADTNGTSFHGSTILTTVNNLRLVLGEPESADNTGEDKVNFDWGKSFTHNGKKIVFTVYDWKEYRVIDEDEVIEFHIGGTNKDQTDLARAAVEQAILNHR